uniref:Uncharacterized protein n=1 Tax=Cacopsylla melanoneura TaxID=428564 RepID=A0A8D8VXK9_9HEMI
MYTPPYPDLNCRNEESKVSQIVGSKLTISGTVEKKGTSFETQKIHKLAKRYDQKPSNVYICHEIILKQHIFTIYFGYVLMKIPRNIIFWISNFTFCSKMTCPDVVKSYFVE